MWPSMKFVATPALLAAALLQTCLAIEDNDVPSTPPDTICGDITNLAPTDSPWFWASAVYECLISVPFNGAVATRFLKYYNETIQFQSTLDLLKSPPTSYRQAPVDLVQGLARIQARVDANEYKNQYAFEHELQALVLSAHDSHLQLYAGVLNQFTFGSNYEVITLSEDGRKTPDVYVRDDYLISCLARPGCTPSPVDTMNGVPVLDFLTEFAANQSFGLLEPHADWNQLVITPALIIQGGLTTFGGAATLYPGDELDIILKNGSDVYSSWFLSLYNSPGYTGPLSTGGDFYNYFVLGLPPASYNATSYFEQYGYLNNDNSSSNSTPSYDNWDSAAYPDKTIVHQQDLRFSGTLTGYLQDNNSTAILSIPSFDSDVDSFSSVLVDFTDRAASANRVIIDLQQNTGGQISLALEAYRQFFPGVVPFTGSRMRAHSTADVIGNNINSYYDELDHDSEYYANYSSEFIAMEWVVTDRINAQTGQNFSLWAEYFGPRLQHDASFTLTQQYNLSDGVFNNDNLAINFPEDSFEPSTPDQDFPWRAEDIVILTDGLCSSACAFFVELMTQQKGVRTVVVGGRPEPGPMQAVSGTRGAASYSGDYLDVDIDLAVAINETAQQSLPLRGDNTDTGMVINYAGFNLRDQVEQNATLPNQMRYLPADCRIYWTFANFNNYTRLWQDVITAVYEDTTLCVPGSTNATASSIDKRDIDPPRTDSATELSSYILAGIDNTPAGAGVEDGPAVSPASFPILCGKTSPDQNICNTKQAGTYCMPIQPISCRVCSKSRTGGTTCSNSKISEYRCLRTCNSALEGGSTGQCGHDTYCPRGAQRNSNVNASGSSASRGTGISRITTSSYCYPSQPQVPQQCSALENLWSRYNSDEALGRSPVPVQSRRVAPRPAGGA